MYIALTTWLEANEIAFQHIIFEATPMLPVLHFPAKVLIFGGTKQHLALEGTLLSTRFFQFL